jgi:hypothetical protein
MAADPVMDPLSLKHCDTFVINMPHGPPAKHSVLFVESIRQRMALSDLLHWAVCASFPVVLMKISVPSPVLHRPHQADSSQNGLHSGPCNLGAVFCVLSTFEDIKHPQWLHMQCEPRRSDLGVSQFPMLHPPCPSRDARSVLLGRPCMAHHAERHQSALGALHCPSA